MEPELVFLTIADLAARYRDRRLSPVEVTSTMLARIDALDGELHSYRLVLEERAQAQAREAEEQIGAGAWRGPLHGVPIAIKDICDLAGTPTTAGMSILAGSEADRDATVVARLKAAGAVILGKLQMTEGAYATHHPEFAVPVNPWSADRWVGASSSGSGVATAAGLCFGSLGTDTGGSIRFPSASCGTVGLKPTFGRVSRHGVFPLADSLDHIGPMTRSVADAAIMLQAIAGHDPDDDASSPEPIADYTSATGSSLDGVRIGIDRRWVSEGVDPAIAATVLAAAETLQEHGARLREVTMPASDQLVEGWPTVASVEGVIANQGLYPEQRAAYGPVFADFLERGLAASAVEYARIEAARLRFKNQLQTLWRDVDVVLCPAQYLQAPPLAEVESLLTDPVLLRFTAPFDFSGSPCLTLTGGFSEQDLPLSFQIVGRHFDEALLCRVGSVYEAATEWHKRHPRL
jgi:amidase